MTRSIPLDSHFLFSTKAKAKKWFNVSLLVSREVSGVPKRNLHARTLSIEARDFLSLATRVKSPSMLARQLREMNQLCKCKSSSCN